MKKNIPLQILEMIEPFVGRRGKSFEVVNPDDFLLKFIDADKNSDFYFNVEQYKLEHGFQLLIEWKPANKQSIGNVKQWVKAEQLEGYFLNWLTLLEGYEKVKTVFDDPIIEAYAEEYFNEFDIIDEDAEVKPFSIKQIILLDDHLESIQKGIEKYQTEDNKSEIEQIKNDIIELRNNLSKKSKKWVITKLSKVWASVTKQGPAVIKEFFNEAKKQAIQHGVKFIIEKGSDLI